MQTKSLTPPAPTIVAPITRDLDTLARQMAEWLEARMPGATAVLVTNLSYPLGAGMSHETILFDASWQENGAARQQGMVVRIKPTQHLVYHDDMFEEQYRLMLALFEDGRVKVARPLWFEPSGALLGAPFFVMERLQGRVAVSMPPYAETGWVAEASPTQRRTLWEASVRQLAMIQTVPVSSVSFLDPDGGPSGFEHEWDRWQRYMNWLPVDAVTPFLHTASEALERTRPKVVEAGIVWGDSRLGNMMIDDDFGVVAVMDWEQPSLGGALHDLAWWLHTERMQTKGRGLPHIAGMGTYDETLALWTEICGKQTGDIAWYEAFTAFKMSCLTRRMTLLGAQIAAGRPTIDTPNNRRMADLLGLSIPAV